jgi:hypothetical protein
MWRRFERLVADGRPAALERIAGLYRGDLLAGLALAERPFDAPLGRRDAALRQYQLCVDALKRELSTTPEAETTQIFPEIYRSRPIHPDRPSASGPASADPAPAPLADLGPPRRRRCRGPRRRICRCRPRS